MGQQVQEDASYIKETYGDWQLQCFRTGRGRPVPDVSACQREDGGQPGGGVQPLPSARRIAKAAAGATIVVPLGTLLPEGLRISVDDGKSQGATISHSARWGVFCRIGLPKAEVDAIKRGGVATGHRGAQAPDERVLIKASLERLHRRLRERFSAP